SAFARGGYVTAGECDGLPRLQLRTPAGFCVGLVAQGFKFPRGLLVLPDGDLLVADMGGWVEGRGSIWRLSRQGGKYERRQVFGKLDRPASLALGPDGKVYVGTVGRVFRFDPAPPQAVAEDVIGGRAALPALPLTGRHPLPLLVFDRDGQLYVNVGSASDNCESPGGAAPDAASPCPETTGRDARGVIRLYSIKWPEGKITGWSDYAHGLRNSMALAIHPDSGALWQGENSRDAISARDASLDDRALPHDELNLIRKGAHYGWPYCYDENRPSPEYAAHKCTDYTRPELLLPPHAAPLGMAFHGGRGWPTRLRNALVVSFHGYRDSGHRLLAYPFGAGGRPRGRPEVLVDGWGPGKSTPMGAPVDVKIAADGAVFVSEDRNGTVLRLVCSAAAGC
ncbi:MAG: PQQ-dependent sugar dehydrogenase, partial [Rhodocyclaceae bacterium]|nr:PQQ-dependent sugar dehydrogenase [Rhodocyclaceae bacterium]